MWSSGIFFWQQNALSRVTLFSTWDNTICNKSLSSMVRRHDSKTWFEDMISLSWNHVLWCWYCELEGRWGIIWYSVHWIQSQTEILGINKIYGHHRWNWIRLSTRHISSSWQDHISLFSLSWNPTFPTIDSGLDHRYNLYHTNSNCWSQWMKEKLTR